MASCTSEQNATRSGGAAFLPMRESSSSSSRSCFIRSAASEIRFTLEAKRTASWAAKSSWRNPMKPVMVMSGLFRSWETV